MLRRRKRMKYCVNSLAVLAAAKLTGPHGGRLGRRRPWDAFPARHPQPGAPCFPLQDPSPGSCFGWKTRGVGGSAAPQTPVSAGGVAPPARGRPTGTSGRGLGEGIAARLAATPRPRDPLAGAGHPPPPAADPPLPPPRLRLAEKGIFFFSL